MPQTKMAIRNNSAELIGGVGDSRFGSAVINSFSTANAPIVCRAPR